jgi:hypothetical protein
MLFDIGELDRRNLAAIDGAMGWVKDISFDDATWAVRHSETV